MARKKRGKFYKGGDIPMGFDPGTVRVRLEDIAPLKLMTPDLRESMKYKQILSSVREVGIIEPPMLAPKKKNQDKYFLLDGHLRIAALKEIGEEEVTCLVSTDDESYTYNKQISRISTIQEHRMIVQAIKRGVSEARIAKALNLDVENIVRKRDLLNGICPEAAELLKDKMVPAPVFGILKKMKAVRQIEVATVMNDTANYTMPCARACLIATPKSQLVNPERPNRIRGLDEEQMARMEAEMTTLQNEYKLIEDSYGTNVLTLTIAKTYVATLLANVRVERHLKQHHAEILRQFQEITKMMSLGNEAAL